MPARDFESRKQEFLDFYAAQLPTLKAAAASFNALIHAILSNLEEFYSLGRPLYIGLSNKSVFGDLLGLKVDERECATQAATAILAKRKIYAHRVHNARDTLNTLKIVESMCPPDA